MRRVLFVLAALLALNVGGFMLFDGVRALTVGDYLTPSSGEYAGQLGPWTHAVEAVGIEPRSTLMKSIFVGFGVVWLTALGAFLTRRSWGRLGLLVLSVATLWYAVIGTACCALLIFALVPLRPRERREAISPASSSPL